MSDEQIIKALECCVNWNCKECPFRVDKGNCTRIFDRELLNIINRQKAEIKRLYKEVDRLSQCVLYHDGQILDAIKDLAEEFEKRCIASGVYPAVTKNILKNLVKELTEESNGK